MNSQMESLNKETMDDDYLTPYFKRPALHPSRPIVYCTSYACNMPKKRTKLQIKRGFKNEKYKEIKKPPADGWCPKCKNALLFTRVLLKP